MIEQVPSRIWLGYRKNGQWAVGCYFYGGESIKNQTTASNKCGGLCQKNDNCTHYSWFNNTCNLQHFSDPKSAKDVNVDRAFCGNIVRYI